MLPFVGPSYQLATRKASVQRSVNLFLVGMETPSKAPFILQSVPGLVQFAAMGAAVRGMFEAAGRCFVVAGNTLYELNSAGVKTARGVLSSSSGPVDFAWGRTQLVVVDGANGYVLTLATNAFGAITDADWLGSDRVAYLDGYFIFAQPGSDVFYISAIDDATNLDSLDFARAEASPDTIVSHAVNHREVWFVGEKTTEVWFDSGAADFPLSRNSAAMLDVGCVATHSLRQVDNALIWIGRDANGSGLVYRSMGYQAARISTLAVEQALQASTDLSSAVAYVYQSNGQTFWCVNAPGITSTWCYEIASQAWHERCDLDALGQFAVHRANYHAFAFGYHLVGCDSGVVYRMDPTFNLFGEDPIKRSRISPNDVSPSRDRIYFRRFTLDCVTGGAGSSITSVPAELSWSDNGGMTWGNPVSRSIGLTGEYLPRVEWTQLGCGRDRVWRVDCSANAPFSIIEGMAE